ncbi:ABC transporter permease [Thermosediminibacter oceani]|uniref:Binding-protein-dependent transport systems inner membrane component n=1 Tax=Thermosediminibacter oceani (strain ATCC BAA-1034 / DSM 16646 / JW/IW-1228P) TaxID=555079 RepID=D9S0P2_THEOJ|nr:ABC transporter permease [Thermosediminibacter oceani]ADL08900.1 binding-protein-dependent transport systems inner membrane component [Thermosediminibacter oceani DSM 16646]
MPVAEYINFMLERMDDIIVLTGQHIQLSFIAIVVAIAIGVPLGILMTRFPSISSFILGLANAVQAIPSLAFLGFLVPIFGIGSTPSIVMVSAYALLPIVKNTYTGLTGIDKAIVEAGLGMGMTEQQLMTMVRIPMALPVIMAGVRIAVVMAVGFTTLAALIGAGGLGQLIYRGISMVNSRMIVAGAVPAMILALAIDKIFYFLEKAVTPKGIR